MPALIRAMALSAAALCFSPAPARAQGFVEARTADGVVVQESCVPPFAGAPAFLPCETAAKRAADVITRLSAVLGPFPVKKLKLEIASITDEAPRNYLVAIPGRISGGWDIYPYLGSPMDRRDLLPREIARQWFEPYYPPAASGPRWLAESLAEYLAWRYLNEAEPEAGRVLVMEAMRDVPAWELPRPPLPTGKRHSDTLFPEIVAMRRHGLLVLRTLETVIDRERVDRVLPLLIRRSGGNPPSVELLEKVCEEVAGRNLKWFFDYYVEGNGIPSIELRRLASESPGVAAGEIVVKGLPPEGSVRVEMAVRTAQGAIAHSVATRGGVTPFSVNVPAPALSITLDPDQRILRWTEAAERWKAQSAVLAELPEPITAKNLAAAIDLYRCALAADPNDASQRAQALRERLGELEWAHDEWNVALADLDAAINGHSISPFETYLCRGKAYLYHGVVQLHERRPKEALEDAKSGLALPREALSQSMPERPIESHGNQTLEQLLQTLVEAATHY